MAERCWCNETQGDICIVDEVPTTRVAGVTYIALKGGTYSLANGTSGNLQWLSNITKVWDDKRYFYPLPPTEIYINTNLDQNKDW